MSSRSPAKKPLPNEFLASLDAAFGASNAATDTQYKYTRKAAISVGIQTSQQAYQGTKKKRKRNASQAHSQRNKARWHDSKTPNNRKSSLYHKLDSESISLGILGAYLEGTRTKPVSLNSYFDEISKNATNKSVFYEKITNLWNKILQLDNPIKGSNSQQQIARNRAQLVQSQWKTRLCARRRPQQKLCALVPGSIKYVDALSMSELWRSYALERIGNEPTSISSVDTVRLRSKIQDLDFMGCPLRVVRSRCPSYLRSEGIVVAETRHAFQLCQPEDRLSSILKAHSTFSVSLDHGKELWIDGNWLDAKH